MLAYIEHDNQYCVPSLPNHRSVCFRNPKLNAEVFDEHHALYFVAQASSIVGDLERARSSFARLHTLLTSSAEASKQLPPHLATVVSREYALTLLR